MRIFQEGVEINEKFACAGGEGDLAGLAFGAQPEVKGFEDGVVLDGDEGGHPKAGAHGALLGSPL